MSTTLPSNNLPTTLPGKVSPQPWATYVEGRTPKFKVHTSLGKARGAISCHFVSTEVGLYKLEEGEWKLQEVIKPPTCDKCGTTAKQGSWDSYLYRVDDGTKNPVYMLPHRCSKCRKLHGHYTETDTFTAKNLKELAGAYRTGRLDRQLVAHLDNDSLIVQRPGGHVVYEGVHVTPEALEALEIPYTWV